MTVCIAMFHNDKHGIPHIIAASDRRVSLFGGYFSQENAVKFHSIDLDWIAMFAGDMEETDLMAKAITIGLAKVKKRDFDAVLNCCRKAYVKQYRRLVETQILPDYDIYEYREYVLLKATDEGLYLAIREKIREREQKWNLLIAGFDKQKHPHIFVIHGPGSIQYCDQQRYAAIGSGDVAALMWLAYFGCPQSASLGWATFGVASAKFFAERASDVGKETIISIMKPGETYAVVLREPHIVDLRSTWDAIPIVPNGVTEDLDSTIEKDFANFKKIEEISKISQYVGKSASRR